MKSVIWAIVAVAACFLFNKWLGVAALAISICIMIYSMVPAYYARKGNFAFASGNEQETLKWYEKAVATGRANIVIKISYAFVLLKTGNPEKAETVLNEILMQKKIPEDKRNMAKQNRCMVYYKLGRLDEAIEEAEELFENYKNTTMYGMLGYFKILNNEDLDSLLEFCLEAYDFNSDDRDIMDNLSIVYYKRGEYDKAREISQKLIKTAPKFIEAYYHGAQIAEKCGDIDAAKEILEDIEDCTRSYMTTVSQREIDELKERLNK